MENTAYKDYLYSPVRLNLVRTGETINIGVIVMDEDRNSRVFRSINSFKDVANCLHLEDASSHDFMLNMINTNLSTSLEFNTNFSNSIFIDKPEWVTSDKSISDTATELYEDMVSIRNMSSRSKISDFTPTKIITGMEDYAKKHKIQNMDFRRKHISSIGKKMDAVVYEDTEKKKLLIGIDVTTRAVNEFTQKALYSAISLQKAVEAKKIKDAVLRMPSIGDKASKQEYREAYKTIVSDYKNVTIIDTADNREFFGVVDTMTKKYGGSLF